MLCDALKKFNYYPNSEVPQSGLTSLKKTNKKPHKNDINLVSFRKQQRLGLVNVVTL